MYTRVKYLMSLLLGFVAIACANEDIYDTPDREELLDENVVELLLGLPQTRATLDED